MIQPKTKFFAALAISGACVAGLLFLLLLPLIRSIQQHSVALYQDRVKAEIAATQQRSARSSRAEYERLKTKAAELQQFFVSEASVLEFISSLESAAGKAGVRQTIDNLRAPDKATRETNLQITVSGSFPAILAWLNNVEELPYYLSLTHLTFTGSEDGGDVQAAVQAKLFWL